MRITVTVTQPKKVTITNYIQVIVIITCNYRYFTHCNWPNSGWYITWRSVVFENCFYQQWQYVCVCAIPIVRWWSLRRKMGPHFLHFGKWLRYTWQNGSITGGEGIFLFGKNTSQARPSYIIIIIFCYYRATFSWEKKISSEKSWMIWNFFFLYLLRTCKNAFTSNYWGIFLSFLWKKVFKKKFCMPLELHFI